MRPDSPTMTREQRPAPHRHAHGDLTSLTPDHVVPTSWQDEALARDGVSGEVLCSALKGETVPDSLPAVFRRGF